MTSFSRHATRRMQQRGIRRSLIEQIVENADVEVPIGSGCTLLRVRKRTAALLNLSDRLARRAVIWSDANKQVVTVVAIHAGRRGSHYLRTH